jgi:hypothetical protein
MAAVAVAAAILFFHNWRQSAIRPTRIRTKVVTEAVPVRRHEDGFARATTLEGRDQERFEYLFAELLATAADDSDPMARERQSAAFQTVVEGMGVQDFAPALRAIAAIESANPTEPGQDLALRIIQHWSETDSSGAAAAVAQLPESDRVEACERIGITWGRTSPEAAANWARSLSDGSERQSALFAIASEEGVANPTQALALLSEMPPSNRRDDLIEGAVSTWSETAGARALQWAGQIPESPLRERIMGTIATTLSAQAPDAAARLALEEMSGGPEQQNTVLAIIQRWAPIDKAAALAWVDKFPPGDLRDRALAAVRRDERMVSSDSGKPDLR